MKVLSKQENKQISGADSCSCLDMVPELDRGLNIITTGVYNIHAMLKRPVITYTILVDTDSECKNYCCENIYHHTGSSPTEMYKFGDNDAVSCNKII